VEGFGGGEEWVVGRCVIWNEVEMVGWVGLGVVGIDIVHCIVRWVEV